MLSKRKLLSLFGLLVVFSLLLAACGPAATEEPTEPPAPEATEAPAAAPTEEPEEEEPEVEATQAPTEEAEVEVEEESSVTILSGNEPASFNVIMLTQGTERLIGEMVLLSLCHVDEQNNIVPDLALELPTLDNGMVTVDEENGTMEVTWKMRDDIYWEDGEPVTADDVLFTWEATADPVTGAWIEGADYIDSVEQVDDYTFVVRYNGIYPSYLSQFSNLTFHIWPEHYCEGEGLDSWDCNRDPLASGPYTLEEWVAGDHLTLVRNPNYFEEGKPAIDRVYVRIVPEEAVCQEMMLQGEGDVDFYIGNVAIDAYEAAEHVKVSYATYGRWLTALFPNYAARGHIDPVEHPHPVLSDVRVRHAMRMAIDVDEIISGVYGTRGLFVPAWTEFFREPYKCDIPRPEYDLEGAKALLEEAGWSDTDGDGVRECRGCTTGAPEGYEMRVELLTYAGWGEEAELAQQLVAEDLEDMGMATDVGQAEGAVIWADAEEGGTEATGNYDVDFYDDGYAGDKIGDFLWDYYHSDAIDMDYGFNQVRWSNEEFDALLDEANNTVDHEARLEAFCRMAEIMDEELPHIWLWQGLGASAHSERLNGVVTNPNTAITWNIADWTLND